MDVAEEMLATFNDNQDLVKKVITGDESWMYGYDIETKASRRAKIEKSTSSSVIMKALLTVFFNCHGMGHHEFLSEDRTVNKVMRQKPTEL